MYTKNISLRRHFRIYTFTVLMVIALMLGHQITVYAADNAEISGNASVNICSSSVSHSAEAAATIRQCENNSVVMQADLSVPGEWACYTFTVENDGTSDAVLTDVIQKKSTTDDLLISFGISEEDEGEILKPGEQCRISIVAQLNPETENDVSVSEDFALTLVYENSEFVRDSDDIESGDSDSEDENSVDVTLNNAAMSTGDSFCSIITVGVTLFSAVILMFLFYKRRSE